LIFERIFNRGLLQAKRYCKKLSQLCKAISKSLLKRKRFLSLAPKPNLATESEKTLGFVEQNDKCVAIIYKY